jgi:hypothetical protein
MATKDNWEDQSFVIEPGASRTEEEGGRMEVDAKKSKEKTKPAQATKSDKAKGKSSTRAADKAVDDAKKKENLKKQRNQPSEKKKKRALVEASMDVAEDKTPEPPEGTTVDEPANTGTDQEMDNDEKLDSGSESDDSDFEMEGILTALADRGKTHQEKLLEEKNKLKQQKSSAKAAKAQVGEFAWPGSTDLVRFPAQVYDHYVDVAYSPRLKRMDDGTMVQALSKAKEIRKFPVWVAVAGSGGCSDERAKIAAQAATKVLSDEAIKMPTAKQVVEGNPWMMLLLPKKQHAKALVEASTVICTKAKTVVFFRTVLLPKESGFFRIVAVPNVDEEERLGVKEQLLENSEALFGERVGTVDLLPQSVSNGVASNKLFASVPLTKETWNKVLDVANVLAMKGHQVRYSLACSKCHSKDHDDSYCPWDLVFNSLHINWNLMYGRARNIENNKGKKKKAT